MRALTKQSHPERSCVWDRCRYQELGGTQLSIVIVPCPCRYDSIILMRVGSVFAISRQATTLCVDSRKRVTRPSCLHRVICFEDSFLHTTVRADVVNAGVPKQALAIGSAPARYLLGNKNTEHFWVGGHYSLHTRPPYSVEIQRGYDSFAIEEVFCRCPAPMVVEGWSHVSSNLKAI
jgi:hypothetical protein